MTVLDDDGATGARPRVSVTGDVSVQEGHRGSRPVSLRVWLSRASIQPVRAFWRTGDGTARKGRDYVALQGSVEFPSGKTTSTVRVQVIGDRVREPNEHFFVELYSPRNATLGNSRARATIVNDGK